MKKIISIVLIICCMLSIMLVSPVTAQASGYEGYSIVAENARFNMYFNNVNADIIIEDKSTGQTWRTIPEDIETQPQDANKMRAMSHIVVILAKGDKAVTEEFNSQALSVRAGTWKYQQIKDGIRIDYEFKDKKVFMGLEITLTDNGILATIPADSVKDNGAEYKIKEIKLLPYFGAVDNEDGYMILPDGSGTLVDFKDIFAKEDSTKEKILQMYGTDKASPLQDKTTITETARLPVFGIKRSDNAILGIVESGEALSYIASGTQGTGKGYFRTYTGFNYRDIQKVVLFKGQAQTATNKFGERQQPLVSPIHITQDMKVRYIFLDKEKADYAGMAETYRNYLIEKGQLKKLEQQGVQFNLSLLGGYRIKESVLGIPMLVMKPLTTFDQAEEIVKKLQDNGVENINLRYMGINKGGFRAYVTDKIKPESKLGGKKGLKDFIEFAKTAGVKLYMNGEINEVFEKGKGFSASRDSVRALSNAISFQWLWSAYKPRTTVGRGWFLLSPNSIVKFATKYADSVKSYGLDSIAFESLGDVIYADYRDKNPVYRDGAQDRWAEALAEVSKSMDNVMLTGGNSFVFPYATTLLNVPMDHSRLTVGTQSIPFYQMVIHGMIPYSGDASNMRFNTKEQFLRMIEYGAVPYYQLMYEESSVMKKSTYNTFYSGNYADWFDYAVDEYKQVKEAYEDINDKLMVGHEKLADGVFKTTYENGVSIIVNYNDTAYSSDGITVAAQNFIVKKGGM